MTGAAGPTAPAGGAWREKALVFRCAGSQMAGVLHETERPSRLGVLVVVGGPQYRVGSHRQFVLLARDLAEAGYPVLRFDYRGMGDSGGPFVGFEGVDQDLGAAVDCFFEHSPGLDEVVIWGLCDAASAALFYAASDRRVRGLVLINPWVRTEQGEARAILRHYYIRRLLQPDFWWKMLSGRFGFARSLGSFLGLIRQSGGASGSVPAQRALPDRLADSLDRFQGEVLLVLSGNDLTAAEFRQMAEGSSRWTRLLGAARVRRAELAEANHTFSSDFQRQWVAQVTEEWLDTL